MSLTSNHRRHDTIGAPAFTSGTAQRVATPATRRAPRSRTFTASEDTLARLTRRSIPEAPAYVPRTYVQTVNEAARLHTVATPKRASSI